MRRRRVGGGKGRGGRERGGEGGGEGERKEEKERWGKMGTRRRRYRKTIPGIVFKCYIVPVLNAKLQGIIKIKVDGAHDEAKHNHDEQLQDGSLGIPDQVLYRPCCHMAEL